MSSRTHGAAANVATPVPSILRLITRLNAGGPARHVVWLEEGLKARGHRSRLISGRVIEGEDDLSQLARDAHLDYAEVASLGSAIRPWSDWTAFREVRREIAAFRPDILHTHTAKAGTVGRMAAAVHGLRMISGEQFPRPRLVHTFHGHVLSGYFDPLPEAAVRWTERALGRLVTDAVIVLSPRQREDIVERFRVAPAEHVYTVPLGLDLSIFDPLPSRGSLRAELSVPNNGFLVGIVGRLAPVKDHSLFLKAVAAFSRGNPEARFVVVGGGPEEGRLRSLAATLGIADRVFFLGLRTDLSRIYADLDAVVLTSRQEGTPLSLLEAMAAGCPTVATAVGGVPDILLQEWSGPVDQRIFCRSSVSRGILVESRDPLEIASCLEGLWREPSRRLALASAGRTYVRRFHGLERLLDDVESVYRRVLSPPVVPSGSTRAWNGPS